MKSFTPEKDPSKLGLTRFLVRCLDGGKVGHLFWLIGGAQLLLNRSDQSVNGFMPFCMRPRVMRTDGTVLI